MKIAFIGDIIGRFGRELVGRYLPSFRRDFGVDLVIANGENATHGFGLAPAAVAELRSYGVDIFTSGNHIWDRKKDIISLLQNPSEGILRPLNYSPLCPGFGLLCLEITDKKPKIFSPKIFLKNPQKNIESADKLSNFENTETSKYFLDFESIMPQIPQDADKSKILAVLNLMGIFGMPQVENPFVFAQCAILELHKIGIKNIFIDFHAEASSEKRALFMMLKGFVSAIIGTHTHVGSDDLEIFSGTLGLSDAGMIGARESVIGMEKEQSIARLLSGMHFAYKVPEVSDLASIPSVFGIILLEIENGICKSAKKFRALNCGELKLLLEA